jgi:hypothetical protein
MFKQACTAKRTCSCSETPCTLNNLSNTANVTTRRLHIIDFQHYIIAVWSADSALFSVLADGTLSWSQGSAHGSPSWAPWKTCRHHRRNCSLICSGPEARKVQHDVFEGR